MHPTIETKRRAHEAFWCGEGPSLILIPAAAQDLYDLDGYPARFRNPRAMWESEMRRAEPVLDWPTDGIPCVRPNLGVVFVPAMAGLSYRLPEGSMPWPGEALSREALRAARAVAVAASETMGLAEKFYAIHRDSGRDEVAAYQADNQGIFDIAHLLYGDQLFYDLADPDSASWLEELFQHCRDLYARATLHVKGLLGESPGSMIHGHGTSQGVYFPTAGSRCSEDTVTLISPDMIETVVLPQLKQIAETFGGLFVHFCGRHPSLLEQLCSLEAVRAIDLGNPEYHDTRKFMECCAATGTVLHSRVASLPGEGWDAYACRLAGLARETGARLILRPTVFPGTREEAKDLLAFWHENT